MGIPVKATPAQETGDRRSSVRKSTLLLFAYLGHLLLPGLLLLDVLTAWQHGRVHFEWWGANTYIGLFSAIWLAMGLGVFLLSCDREGFLRKISNPLVSIWVIYAMLVLMEVFARTTLRLAPPIPGQLPPGRTRLGPINPAVFPGIHGVKTFTINALGFRGPMPPPRKLAYRILAVGGSTTICTYLDDSEEWPHVLMEKMNAAPESLRVWVGNAGVSGRTTVYHLVFLQWLPGVIDVDMVIFLVGINDFLADLAFEGASNQKLLEKTAGYEGDLAPGTRWRSLRPYYQRLQLYQVIARATGDLRQRFGARQGEDSTEQLPTAARASDIDVPWFRQRRASMPPAPMPDLSTGTRRIPASAAFASQLVWKSQAALFVSHAAEHLSARPESDRVASSVGGANRAVGAPQGICFRRGFGTRHGRL